MVIIMNKIHYIYKYDKLKYGLFIDSSLTGTGYYWFYEVYKKGIWAQIFKDPPINMPVVNLDFWRPFTQTRDLNSI